MPRGPIQTGPGPARTPAGSHPALPPAAATDRAPAMTLRLVPGSFPGPSSSDPSDLSDGPILIVDSGLGGLTVARAVRRRLPAERVVYAGDAARVPYGGKSPRAIRAAATSLVRAVFDRLDREGSRVPKHVVVACNSASAVALPALREACGGVGVSGVIAPGAKAASRAAGPRVRPAIGVIATEATVRSRAYELAIGKRRPRAALLLRPTPLLVPLVEEGRGNDDPVVKLVLEDYLRPMIERATATVGQLDALVLGCTHYPMLKPAVREVVGPETAVIDSASAAAEDVAGRLTHAGLLRPLDRAADAGPTRVFATDLPPRFAKLARRFLNGPMSEPELLEVDDAPARELPLRQTA